MRALTLALLAVLSVCVLPAADAHPGDLEGCYLTADHFHASLECVPWAAPVGDGSACVFWDDVTIIGWNYACLTEAQG